MSINELTAEGKAFFGGGGYEFIEVAATGGWKPIPAWGRDGWDLGSWPLVLVLHRNEVGYRAQGEPRFSLAYYVEGDVEIKHFATREERDAATDEIAAFHWRWEGAEWIRDYPEGTPLPDHLRGPYSRTRVTEEAS